MFRPTTLVRRVRPLRGAPRIRVVVRPRTGYGSGRPEMTRGSNHLRFVMPDLTLRLTTHAPIAYVAHGDLVEVTGREAVNRIVAGARPGVTEAELADRLAEETARAGLPVQAIETHTRLRAQVERLYGLSAHADRDGLLRWLRGFTSPPKRLFLTHGEADVSQVLAETVRAQLGWTVEVPEYGDEAVL